MGHFNQNPCPGSRLSEESEKCARKYLLVRKYLLSTVSAAAGRGLVPAPELGLAYFTSRWEL